MMVFEAGFYMYDENQIDDCAKDGSEEFYQDPLR